jgi:lysophospholipid acyltransferase 7
VETEEFANRAWFYRFVYSNAVFFTFRMRMYSAFIISECVCINAGLGAYPKRLKAQSGVGPTVQDTGAT